MKTLAIILLLVSLFLNVNAQETLDKLKNGNYLQIKNKDAYKGVWKSSSEDIEFQIDFAKKAFKNSVFDFTADVILIKIKRFIHNNKDISSLFKVPLELWGDESYIGFYEDPVTKNRMKITINFIDKKQIRLIADYSAKISFEKNTVRSTIFPTKPVIFTK